MRWYFASRELDASKVRATRTKASEILYKVLVTNLVRISII